MMQEGRVDVHLPGLHTALCLNKLNCEPASLFSFGFAKHTKKPGKRWETEEAADFEITLCSCSAVVPAA